MSKKKRKFRAMTVREWCIPKRCLKCEYHYAIFYCNYLEFNGIDDKEREKNKPYKTKDGKYIFIEVKE